MSPFGSNQSITAASPLKNGFYHGTSNVDDLTATLANFSRASSPEPPSAITCCCGRESCENLRSWLALKSHVGGKLILSAGK